MAFREVMKVYCVFGEIKDNIRFVLFSAWFCHYEHHYKPKGIYTLFITLHIVSKLPKGVLHRFCSRSGWDVIEGSKASF